MKSRDLIAELQKLDPEGDIEVCVNNVDVYFCSLEAAFWDGSLQVLTRDESKKPYYSITGARYVNKGSKIVLHPMSVRDVLWDNPDTAVIDYSELSPVSRSRYEECDNKTRQAARDSEKRCEMDLFYRWAEKRALPICEDLEDLRDEVDQFYNDNPQRPTQGTSTEA